MNQIDPREVLALVPHQLTFAPDNSLVVVPVTDADGKACTTKLDRIDLHPDALPSAYAAWVRSRVADADGTVLIAYATSLERAGRVLRPLTDIVDGVRAAIAVAAGHWVDLTDPAGEPSPLPDGADTLIGAQMRLRNSTYYASRDEAFGYGPAPSA